MPDRAPATILQNSLTAFDAFNTTGDYTRDGILQDLALPLESGVRIGLIYGDRDYIRNWLGGEAISYAIAGAVQPQYAPWYSAGYAPYCCQRDLRRWCRAGNSARIRHVPTAQVAWVEEDQQRARTRSKACALAPGTYVWSARKKNTEAGKVRRGKPGCYLLR